MTSHPERAILIVDDNVSLAENLAEILEAAGWPTKVAASAEVAFEMARSSGCAAIISDFRLPGRDGIDLLSDLRAAGCTSPLAIMTAYADTTIVERAEERGAVCVLAKPLDIAQILSLLSQMEGLSESVLVVDDNSSFADNMADVLVGAGLAPIVKGTATDALSHRDRVGAALVDVHLPDGDGFHVAARLKTRYPDTRVMMMSAFGLPEVQKEIAQHLPDVTCLSKPVDVARLLAWIRGEDGSDAEPRRVR